MNREEGTTRSRPAIASARARAEARRPSLELDSRAAGRPTFRMIVRRAWACLVLAGIVLLPRAPAASAPTPDAEPAFQSGLAAWLARRPSGPQPDPASTQWAPGLQLLVGVSATSGRKQTIHFIELTTLPVAGASADGPTPAATRFQTNRFSWTAGDGEAAEVTLVSPLVPVRVRLLDAAARPMETSDVHVPWDLLAQSVAGACAVMAGRVDEIPRADAPPGNVTAADHAYAAGMMSLLRVFAIIQATPALAQVRREARCAVRLPSAWTLLTAALGADLTLSLDPRFDEVTPLAPSVPGKLGAYRMPMDLKANDRVLTTVEVLAGPAGGAGVILAGVTSIRAIHPSRDAHEFAARVLFAGALGDGTAR